MTDCKYPIKLTMEGVRDCWTQHVVQVDLGDLQKQKKWVTTLTAGQIMNSGGDKHLLHLKPTPVDF